MSHRIKTTTSTDQSHQDVKIMKKYTSIEENNNEISILATNFENMGGLADKCIQNLETGEEKGKTDGFEVKNHFSKRNRDIEYDYDSDDFENDSNDEELEESAKNISTVAIVHTRESRKNSLKVPNQTNINSERMEKGSIKSCRSTEKVFVPQNGKVLHRKMSNSTTSLSGTMRSERSKLNKSFSKERAREIHRQNHILMHKLMNAKSSNMSIRTQPRTSRETSSTIARRKMQEKTNHENLILLRKIQEAKSSNCCCRR